jgi:hypothetical protein
MEISNWIMDRVQFISDKGFYDVGSALRGLLHCLRLLFKSQNGCLSERVNQMDLKKTFQKKLGDRLGLIAVLRAKLRNAPYGDIKGT